MSADTETIREALERAQAFFGALGYGDAVLAALGRVEDRQGQLLAQGGRLADQAAWTVAYPRLFHENDNECQHALSQAVAGFRLAARAALAGSVAAGSGGQEQTALTEPGVFGPSPIPAPNQGAGMLSDGNQEGASGSVSAGSVAGEEQETA